MFLFLVAFYANSQVSAYTFLSESGTYTEITGGTVLATATAASGAGSLDDVVYTLPAGTIPFTFNFNGSGYTGFNLSTNGFITFGATAPTTGTYTPISSTTAYAGCLAPIGRDLNSLFNVSGYTGEIRYQTLGVAPNRVFVIQYKNFRPYSTSTATTPIWRWNFQIHLVETTNAVKFVYDFNFVGAPTSGTAQVGLRGPNATFPLNVNNRMVTTGTHTWATSVPGTSSSSTCAYSTTLLPASGLTYTFTPPQPCSGTPAPGNTIASTNPVCSGANFTLSLQNSTPGTGVTYQWQSSPNGNEPWTNFGTSVSSITTTQVASAYYRCRVTCGGNTGESNPVYVTMVSNFLDCYCSSTATNLTDEWISNVTFAGINNNSGSTGYSNFKNFTAEVNKGSNVPFAATITQSGSYTETVAVWIDWNQSGTFETTEYYQIGTCALNGCIISNNIAVPHGALLGLTGMRVVLRYSTYQTNPCEASFTFGEVEDYTVNVNPPLPFGFLAGTVTDGNNLPLEGVLVTADLSEAFTTTDANGYYSLELLVGSNDVLFSKAGYSSQTIEGIEIIGGETTTQNATLQELAGSKCSNAIVAGAFPYEALNQTNCGYGNFYSETCLGLYDGGEDILYQFTLTSVKDVVITVNPNGTQWAGVLLSSDCPPVNCVDYKTNGSATTPMVISKRLEAGNYYVMVDTWPTPNCIPSFNLTITAQDPPPPGKITGLVFDENGNRLPSVKVTLGSAKEVVYTNALGRYTFFPVEPGLYDVSFEKANYITQLFDNVEVEPSGTTELNVNMTLVPPPDCPTLVYPAIDQTVLPSTTLQWAPSGVNPPTGYRLYLYNVTSDIWIEDNTDLGNVTSYTPAEPFESGSYFAWLLVPYNFSGETAGCEPWFFYVSYYGQLTGVITDNSTGLPIENAAIFVQQTLPGNYSTTIYTDATGTYNFDWESGNYNLTVSKYGYTSKTLTNVPINPNQTTVMNTTLNPIAPYSIPFVENWGSGTFAAQQWTVAPASTNWSVVTTAGNPAPSARFYYSPNIFNYSRRLQSHLINGVGKDKIYAQFDLLLDNYDPSTMEKLIFGVYDGVQWNVINTFNNQNGDILWTNFSFDISQFAAGKLFQIGFTAEGVDSYNIDWWYIDNIYITTSLMEVSPPAISDQLSTTGTSQWPITISNPGAKALFWNATLNLPQPWATLSAMSGVVSAGGQQIIQLNFNGAAVPPGVYQGQVVISGANGVVSEVIDIQLEVFDMLIDPMAIYDELQVGETSVWNIELTNPGPYPLEWNAEINSESTTKSNGIDFTKSSVPSSSIFVIRLDFSSGVIPAGGTQVVQLTIDATEADAGFYESEIRFTAANGLISKIVNVSTDVYDMMVSPGGLYDALLVGQSSTYQVTITNPNSVPLDWIVDLNETWASLSAVTGTIPPFGSTTLDFTFDATGMLPGAYYSSMTFSAFDGELEKVVLLGLEVFDQPFQKIPIPAPNSWGYISTYLNLNSKMMLEDAMQNILEEMIIMVGFDGIFWPSQNINTIGHWNNDVAYKIKMGAEGLLVFTGQEIENKTITFPAGTYLIPVLSNSAVPAASIFGGKDIEFAFGLDGAIWWPFGNVYTLETLYPGYGYLVKFNSTTTLSFNVTKTEVLPNSVAVFENTTPWNDAYNTGNVHIVGVSAEAANTLQKGDFIGIFNAEGLCTGLTKYSGKNEAFVIPVYGNDLTTDKLDGMKEGELMEVRIFSNNEVIVAQPVYSTQLNHSDLFASSGLSLITDLKAGSTGTGGNFANTIRIYPNPSNGYFTIAGAVDSYNVTVMNTQGQVVFNSKLNSGKIDLTGQPSGVYFIKLIGNDQTITQKVVIR